MSVNRREMMRVGAIGASGLLAGAIVQREPTLTRSGAPRARSSVATIDPAVVFVSPPTMPPTQGFSQVARVRRGELIYLSGQVGVNAAGRLAGKDYASQLEQVFRNIQLGLAAAGARLDDLVKLNFYVASAAATEDLIDVHVSIRDRYIDREAPPASAFVYAGRLAQTEWLLECEAIAVRA